MKWLLAAALIGLIGPLALLLRSRPHYVDRACFVLGVLVFFSGQVGVTPIVWSWPDAIKGFEVSLVDVVAAAIILATPRVTIPAVLKLAVAVYLAALVVSTSQAEQSTAALFYVWQLMRATLVAVAVARATASSKNAPFAIAGGLGVVILYEALLATKQYLGGNLQPGGTLGHRNSLGMASHFAVMPAFAMLLAGRRTIFMAAVVGAGLVIALLGGSRATLGLLGAGLIITMLLSIRHRVTGRKGALAGAVAAALVLGAPIMWWSVDRRTQAELHSSDAERDALKSAARMMIADHPLGVGANQYLIVANVEGYSSRAGVAWNFANRSAPVHDSYYLVTAELGFLGLAGLLATLAATILLAVRAAGRGVPSSDRSELLVGFAGALTIVALHLNFEWIFVTNYIHYLLAINLGSVVGIRASLRMRRGRRLAPARPASAAVMA